MRGCRIRSGLVMGAWALGMAFLVATGCSPQEELTLDPSVASDYPITGVRPQAGVGSGSARESSLVGGPVSPSRADTPAAEEPLHPEDIERQLRIALRTAERGDSSRAIRMLDRILSLDPLNREALYGRASI